ncbi:MAG: hypothetical protein IIC33_00995 [Chloroflexi bacterium]|nr:hypothetical protein [Chloroflexota bacterium]
MSTFHWYRKAKLRVEEFLPDLDNDLEVEVEETSITPSDGGDEYKTFVLVFAHTSNPNLRWTLEVKAEDDFIDHELEEVVKKIYFERVE